MKYEIETKPKLQWRQANVDNQNLFVFYTELELRWDRRAVGVTGVSTQIRRRPGAHFQTIRYILLRARARRRARHPENDLLLR